MAYTQLSTIATPGRELSFLAKDEAEVVVDVGEVISLVSERVGLVSLESAILRTVELQSEIVMVVELESSLGVE